METVADCLFQVARFACSIQAGFEEHSFSRRERAAEFLAYVTDSLDAIVAKLELGEEPVFEVIRLGKIMDQLPAFIRTFDNTGSGRDLIDFIEHAQGASSATGSIRNTASIARPYDRRIVSFADWRKARSEKELLKLKQASNAFRTVCGTVLTGL